jgi:hypothetical protein
MRGRIRQGEALETGDHEAAAKVINNCRLQRIAVPVSGMLICAAAMSRSRPIFTSETDFQFYANILPIELHKPRK